MLRRRAVSFNCTSFPICYGKKFTDRIFGLRRHPHHELDHLCADLGIETSEANR